MGDVRVVVHTVYIEGDDVYIKYLCPKWGDLDVMMGSGYSKTNEVEE